VWSALELGLNDGEEPVRGVRASRSIADMLVKAWKVPGTLALSPLSNAITGAIYKLNANTTVILMSLFIEQSSLN